MSDAGDACLGERTKIELRANSLQSEAAHELSSRLRVVGDRDVLLDSMRSNTVGAQIGTTDKSEEMTATLVVRSKASDKEFNNTLAKIASHEMKPLSAQEFNDKFGADPESMERVLKFAKNNGLTVEESHMNSGEVLLKGKVENFSKAFYVQFNDYKLADGQIARERLGTFSVPKEIGTDVEGVLGLDDRLSAKALMQKAESQASSAHRESKSYLPNELADIYDFPKESMGAGQAVAIIELGGGLDLADNAKFYQEAGLKLPDIQIVSVDGASSKANLDTSSDGEVALDTQVIGAVAPDAKQQVIFAPNDNKGFYDSVTRATFAQDGERQNSAISISWGGRESGWDAQEIKTMDQAFKKAALQGLTVFVASGDTGAGDFRQDQPLSAWDGKFVADFPASDPWVIATGGTQFDIDTEGKRHEVVWNDHDVAPNEHEDFDAGGGGVSRIFERPDYQKGIDIPANPQPFKTDGVVDGRGAPDIAGEAVGYKYRVGGQPVVNGGTSAVAPLYAALIMRVNGALGQPVGFLNPFLYKHGQSGIFNDITEGNNNGFKAGPGWDAATGWGSIRGTEFLKQLRSDLSRPNRTHG